MQAASTVRRPSDTDVIKQATHWQWLAIWVCPAWSTTKANLFSRVHLKVPPHEHSINCPVSIRLHHGVNTVPGFKSTSPAEVKSAHRISWTFCFFVFFIMKWLLKTSLIFVYNTHFTSKLLQHLSICIMIEHFRTGIKSA